MRGESEVGMGERDTLLNEYDRRCVFDLMNTKLNKRK
jgi:hypothetical protein